MSIRARVTRSFFRGAATLAVVLGAPLTYLAPASAADLVVGARPTDSTQTQTQTHVSQDCIDAIQGAIADGEAGLSTDVCTTTTTLTVGPTETVTLATAQGLKSSMSASDYASLLAAVATTTVRSKPYSQTMNNVTDQERQYGTFYYNGSRAWVTVTYSGRTGTHFRKVDWAVGYAVSLVGCTESGTTSQRNLYAHWKFSLVANESPIAWDEIYTLHVNASGSIWQ